MNLVISTSLNPDSKSRILAHAAYRRMQIAGVPAEFIDLRDYRLPLSDGGAAYGHADVQRLGALTAAADSLVIATPIYNYNGNAALKNLVELTGKTWEGKAVGFLCAAGGNASYMSVMGLASSLMLDFRCLVVPRFVYATGDAFSEGIIRDASVVARTNELVRTTVSLGQWAREQRLAAAA